MGNRNRGAKVLFGVLGVLTCAASALAGGGNVLPASATSKGYSLPEIVAATAVYLTGTRSHNPATPPPPDVPFQILVGDTTVKPGTMLYVPIFFDDDSGGAPAGFPADVSDQEADADYLDAVAFSSFGVEAFIVQVDGQTTIIDDDYITGVTTPPLLDGTPGGTHYIRNSVFLTPLTPGQHTVSVGGIIGGEPVVFLSRSVTVR